MKTYSRILRMAMAKRDHLLMTNPGLQKYQEEIDTILGKTPASPLNRCDVFKILIESKIIEFGKIAREVFDIFASAKKTGNNEPVAGEYSALSEQLNKMLSQLKQDYE